MADALFTIHGGSGRIKRGANGKYKLIISDLDATHSWFTNRPNRLQGTLSTQEITEGWEGYFGKNPPNSVVSFHDDNGAFKRIAFEQLKPRLKDEGTKMVSRMKMLPSTAAPEAEGQSPSMNGLDYDPVTGFKLKRGESVSINDPSVVVDDFTLSQITIVNNSSQKMQVDYVIGEMKAGAILTSRDLPAGTSVVLTGTTHDKWDVSANVMVWEKTSWKKGLIIQADNPWYETPQIEINMTGRYYNSSQFKKDVWYKPGAGEDWLLQSPNPVLDFKYHNDNPGDGDGNKAWTFVFTNQNPSI
ncbi:hypothetical protein [Vulcanococcus sp. Clear-D1]|jgi:hypothetical protein|uniref:hypothetical protein n=1 Tax=Vulcanococcus sp. Clear-D1 TaxID=2766970 RepID=UPI0019C12D9C|nr:hypothetical protein [Vulcanococcus sp. Clear-D1]MBD1193102.1 hypothetical protein [Vulcanococcus sp. Clear-D1]